MIYFAAMILAAIFLANTAIVIAAAYLHDRRH